MGREREIHAGDLVNVDTTVDDTHCCNNLEQQIDNRSRVCQRARGFKYEGHL